MLHAFCPLHHWPDVIPGIRWGWGCWSYMSCTRSQVVSSSENNICLSLEMLSYYVGIVPVGVLDLGWLETRGVSFSKHQCASAPRTSGRCRLSLMADLSLKKKNHNNSSGYFFTAANSCLLHTIKQKGSQYLIRTCSSN